MTGAVLAMNSFARNWQARILPAQPLIMPARHITLPHAVPGEEDAMARGALWIEVRPEHGRTFMAQCALGFAGGGVAHGIWSTPNADVLLAAAGGYAYCIDTLAPEKSFLMLMRPVVQVHAVAEERALVLTGFHSVCVLTQGETWETPRLSWEGITVERIEGGTVHGTGWHMRTDRELPFIIDLHTREVTGGAFLP